jgi:hypothetical protein
MKAPFVASLIRTGHLDNPVWRAIRYALHKWVRGISPLNRALDLLTGEGYTRIMAVAIATEFDKQCRNRTQFASKPDDNPIYELPNVKSQVQPGHDNTVSLLPRNQSGMRVSTAASQGQAGVYPLSLQEPELPAIRRDIEQRTVSDDGSTGTLGSTVSAPSGDTGHSEGE